MNNFKFWVLLLFGIASACSSLTSFSTFQSLSVLKIGEVQLVLDGAQEQSGIRPIFYQSLVVGQDKMSVSKQFFPRAELFLEPDYPVFVFSLENLRKKPCIPWEEIRASQEERSLILHRTVGRNSMSDTPAYLTLFSQTGDSDQLLFSIYFNYGLPVNTVSEVIVSQFSQSGNCPQGRNFADIKDISLPVGIQGIAVGPQQEVYLAVMPEHKIYRLRQGKLDVFAGTGKAGDRDGWGSEAQFRFPRVLESDKDGNLYLIEAGANRIRKITPQGQVSTLAGALEPGYQEGNAIAARFNSPFDLAISPVGTVLVSDLNNHRIRQIDLQGQVTTLLGNGQIGFSTGSVDSVQVGHPMGLDFAPMGELYYVSEGRVLRTLMADFIGRETRIPLPNDAISSYDSHSQRVR